MIMKLNVCALLLMSVASLSVEGYEVTIMITPPMGPYQIGNTINLSCLIDPIPPDPVTYRWRVFQVFSSWDRTGQNVSYTLSHYKDLRHPWLYCEVLSNMLPVTRGKKVIEVNGFVYPLGHQVRFFTSGETLSLQVNVSTRYYRASRIQSLVWYHNGSQICTCRTRNNGTELVISNARKSDAGIYEVKISSLDFGKPDCDARLLPEMESLAMTAPVMFVLTHDDFYEYEPLDYLSRKRYFVYNSNLNSNVSMELSETYCFHTNTTQQLLQLHYEDWYQIGTYNHLNTNNPKYNSSVFSKVNGELWFTLEVSNISADDLGDYYGVIGISVYDLTTWCREYRYSFIPFHWRYNYGIIPVAVIHSSLEIYRPPLLTILFSPKAALSGETVHIVCSAVDGNPDLHNITLIRNNIELMVVNQTNSLLYYAKHDFGLYTCLVESLYTTASESLLLQEKANFQLLVNIEAMHCNQLSLDNSSTNMDVVIYRLCNCSAMVQLISSTCTSAQLLMLKGTVTYSDESGNITATTVVESLQEWILTTEDASIEIRGNTFKLSKSCPTKINRLTNKNRCLAFSVESHAKDQTIAGNISGSFIGGAITGFALTIVIWFGILKLKSRVCITGVQSQHAIRNKDREEDEVVMGTNEAYKTVVMRYQQPHSVRGNQGNSHEEPVYEIAFT